MELITLHPLLELAQSGGRISTRGLTDKGIALGDECTELLEPYRHDARARAAA